MPSPNYTPGIGALATSRYDFRDHYDGYNFRHNAIQIDVNPAVIIDGELYITVADALNAIGTYITSALGNGEGFVTVGDGYDTYHNANGTINFDPTIPSLDTLLNPLFQTIANAQTVLAGNVPLPFPSAPTIVPTQYARIQYGGVIVIKSGTYIVKQMIQVPPGITLLGEGYGTKIINATALNTNVSVGTAPHPARGSATNILSITNATNANPIQITTSQAHGLSTNAYVNIANVNGNTNANTILTQITVIDNHNFTLNGISGNGIFTSSPSAQVLITNPIFFILPDQNRNDNDGKIDQSAGAIFMFSRETKIANLVIADNFVEPTILGDTNYTAAQNLTNSSNILTVALIYQQNGSNLSLENVFAIGRVSFSSGTTVNSITATLVETFVYPIIPNIGTNTSTGTILSITNCFIDGFAVPFVFLGLNGNLDFVNITNSKIRAFGYLQGLSSPISHSGDNTFLSTSAANINIVGNHFYGNDVNIASIVDINQTPGSPTLQQKAKITSSSNTISIGNIGSSNNIANTIFTFYTYNGGSFPDTYVSLSGVYSTHPTILSAAAPYSLSSPFTINNSNSSIPFNNTFLIDTSSISWQIILPNLTSNAVGVENTLTIKDYTGNSSSNNIFVIAVDNSALQGTPTTISTANVSLPQSTIAVSSTTNFPSSGTFTIISGAGLQTITYGGKTPTTFTTCSGGTGNIFINSAINPQVLSTNFAANKFVSINDGHTIGWYTV